jgi:hypothetical protein
MHVVVVAGCAFMKGRVSRLCLDHVGRVSAVSDLAKAIRYSIRHWPGLTVFLEDGRVEMDTNVVERAIRPNTLTRKNACSLVTTLVRHTAHPTTSL